MVAYTFNPRQGQLDLSEFEDSLVGRVSTRTVRAIQSLKNSKKKERNLLGSFLIFLRVSSNIRS